MDNPCITCGACCVKYQVSFYWGEAEPSESAHPVPKEYFDDRSSFYRVLKRKKDSAGNLRCIALEGEVGKKVGCGIYENRPTPCRDFNFSHEDGVTPEPRCDEARVSIGLLPLFKP